MGAITGARAACHLGGVLPGPYGCAPGGAPTGALVGALLALGALPLLRQGTRPGELAAHRPTPTTTTAARLIWLAIAAALGRWLAEGLLNPQMGLEGIGWMAILPVVLVAAAGLAMAAQGLLDRREWARWAAVVAYSLLGITALAGLVDWTGALMRSRADGQWPIPAAAGRGRPGHSGAVPGHQRRGHRAAHDPSHQPGLPVQPAAAGRHQRPTSK
jgi:hypothetical protein